MTREEAIKEIRNKACFQSCSWAGDDFSNCGYCEIYTAIKGLEALGNIKSDIIELQKQPCDYYADAADAALYDAYENCIDLVDSYIQEVEKNDYD